MAEIHPLASVEALQDRVSGFALCFFPAIHVLYAWCKRPCQYPTFFDMLYARELALVSSKARAPPSFTLPLPSASIHLENAEYWLESLSFDTGRADFLPELRHQLVDLAHR